MVDAIIKHLGLVPHPEGGYFRQTWRAAQTVDVPQGQRHAGTAIYYLLTRDSFAAWHRVRPSDEVWHLYDGGPVRMYLIDPGGALQTPMLGRDLAHGYAPQIVVPAGVWQAAECEGEYALCGCTVAPGFDFADWDMPSTGELVRLHPQHEPLLRRLSRPVARAHD